MNENELKSIEHYAKKLEEDPSSFTDFEANDYLKLLKNNNQNDEAIEVGKTFLSMAPNLKGYLNQYGYALYNKFINVDDETIKTKENLFFDIFDEILDLCKQERYSPVESCINRVIKYAQNQTPINYELINKVLEHLDVNKLSSESFTNSEGREYESRKERYFRLRVRALYEIKEYRLCVEIANNALASNLKWHYSALQWIKYYRGCCLVELKEFDEAKKEFISLHNRIRGINFYEVLYRTDASLGNDKQANTYLLYEFFENGYDVSQMSLYTHLKQACNKTGNELVNKVVSSFIKALANENNLESDEVIDEKYTNKDSSELYDLMYEIIMNNLGLFVERHEGNIVYYNEENKYGSIGVYDQDNVFFRQADFIYDEEVMKRDRVEYTLMPTFDNKKQRLTSKAILIKTIDDFGSFGY